MKFEKHIEIDAANTTAVELLQQNADLSKQRIKQAMTKGAVWLTRGKYTQRIRRADKPLQMGDTLHIYYDEKLQQQQPDDAILIADETVFSIWHKPYGMLCQGSKWGDHCTINRWVEKHLAPQRPAFIVHRLDRAATGLVIIAHQKKIAAYFANLFQARRIEKHYQACVHGCFPDHKTLDSAIEDKPAVSHAKRLGYDDKLNQSLLEIRIETGRKHQIRRHLSEAGFPIVGDRLFGGPEQDDTRDLCLTSCYLAFASPVDGETKTYTLPAELLPKLG